MIGVELSNPENPGRDLALPVTLLRGKGVHLTYTYFEAVRRMVAPLTLT